MNHPPRNKQRHIVAPPFALTNLPPMLSRYSRVASERVSRPFGLMSTRTTFTRCLKGTHDFEEFWFNYRSLFAETSSLSDSAIS